MGKKANSILALMCVLFIALVAFAVQHDYLLFADGGFFAFALAVDSPWDWLWRQFPSRIGALGLTQGPSWLAAHFGASPYLVSKLYQANFLLMPLFAVALTWSLTRQLTWVAWAAFASVALSLPLLGFPSEVYVAGALLTPVFASADAVHSKGKLATACILATLFIFSHEAALLCLPMLLYRLYASMKEPSANAKLLAFFGAWIVLSACVLIFVKLSVSPSNPHVAQAIAKNAKTVFQLGPLKRPLAEFAILGVVAAGVMSLRSGRFAQKFTYGTIGALLAAIFCFAWLKDLPRDRYDCRTVVVWLLPAIAILYALRTKMQPPLLATTFALFMAIMLVQAKSVNGWIAYQGVLASDATHGPLKGSEWRHKVAAEHPELVAYYWPWAAPYTSVLLARNGTDSPNWIMDDQGWYSPVTCTQIRHADSVLSDFFGESFRLGIEKDACRKNNI